MQLLLSLIPDIREVHTEYDQSQFKSANDFHNAVVSGVSRIFKYKSCMNVGQKLNQPTAAMADVGPVTCCKI